jgi:tetratricopeptide (TPR) repeat protein
MAANARAQPATESIVREGLDLRRAGRDAEALAVFERALAVDGSARTRAQVALAEQALGLWVEAERELSAALAAGDDPWFAHRRGALQAALDAIRVRLATLNVETNVAGAELWVNGSNAGTMPLRLPLRIVAGTISIEVRAPGFETQTRTVQVAPQTHARELMDLTRLSTPPTLLANATGTPERTVSVPLDRLAVSPAENATGVRTAAWVSLGSAVVLLAGAGLAAILQNTNAAVYNDDARCFYGGLTRDQRCGGYREAASTAQAAAVIEFEAAAVAVGLSVVLFNMTPRAGGTARLQSLQCTAGIGIQCGATF